MMTTLVIHVHHQVSSLCLFVELEMLILLSFGRVMSTGLKTDLFLVVHQLVWISASTVSLCSILRRPAQKLAGETEVVLLCRSGHRVVPMTVPIHTS